MAKKHISVTNERVLKALDESRNASRLIEKAILYYLDSIENEYVTADQVRSMIMDCLSSNIQPIKNSNYEVPTEDDINNILNL